MAISTGNRVKFIYIAEGSEMPASPDDSTIYYLAGPQQIYVGSELLADVTDYTKIHSDILQYNTTAGWSAQPQLKSKAGCLYVYTDYSSVNNQDVPGFKFGDGSSYVVDLPFSDAMDALHRANTTIHVTAAEKEAWNNKVRCYVDPNQDDVLIFTTS